VPDDEPAQVEAVVTEPTLVDAVPTREATAVDPLETLAALGDDDDAEERPDCRLSFASIEVELPDPNPVVVLQEADLPYRQLRITIGSTEGIAIAYAWREIPTPKPLTHELFADTMRSFGLTLEVVRITAVHGTSFSAELVLSGRPGQRTLPCRPSDGIALALRQYVAVPIMATAEVMDQAATPPH
jgi:bifunctional DNase/RNase